MDAQQGENNSQMQSEYQSSSYSSEDEDGVLLTDKVEEKILTTVAKLRNKDPEIYNIKKPIFDNEDFEKKDQGVKGQKKKNDKFTYKDLVTNRNKEQSSDEDQKEKKQLNLEDIKNSFKNKLKKNEESNNDEQDLFKIKKKAKALQKTEDQKLKQFVQGFENQSSKLLKNYWTNENKLDKTDLFLRNYIINQRWKTSKMKETEQPLNKQKQQMIDEEDEQRSVEMDEYEANYNFRFQEPGSQKVAIYPRQIPESMRTKSDTRKQKRKKLAQRKKNQQQQIRKQYEQKKAQKKQKILQKLQQNNKNPQQQSDSSDFQHDWFFCDDCTKALEQKQEYYVCYECGQYMLCQQCHDLIIHKHKMERAVIPIGAGPPPSDKASKALSQLKSCKTCRKKIPHYLKYYEYNDKHSQMINIMCQKCYDESPLDAKKKFKLVQPKNTHINYQQILDTNPQKIKQLNTQKDIEELVDEYIKCDFEDVIGGGLKTKFKYINVKPEGYGLSDQQILYGDDKQLNKYVSIKKLGAYDDEDVKLRNNMYNRKIRFINKSAIQNKKLLNKIGGNTQALRAMKKIQTRAQILKKRRESRSQKLRIINVSNPEDEKKLLLPKSRLASYGLAIADDQQHNQQQNTQKQKKQKRTQN